MSHSKLFDTKFLKTTLAIAIAGAFAAGCATPERVANNPPVSRAGPAGPAGPTGATGERGATGETGAQGAAMYGATGADGPAGPQGMQGPTGATGATGGMVVGRAGEAGPAGATGAQGATGLTGAQGSSIPGPRGATGASGPQGSIGPTGAQGAKAGVNGGWTLYRDFTFEGRSDDIIRSDSAKAGEIAHHMKQNPSQQVAIDGPNKRYVHSVYNALVDAGVPKSKIQTGTFGDQSLSDNRRVAVLVGN